MDESMASSLASEVVTEATESLKAATEITVSSLASSASSLAHKVMTAATESLEAATTPTTHPSNATNEPVWEQGHGTLLTTVVWLFSHPVILGIILAIILWRYFVQNREKAKKQRADAEESNKTDFQLTWRNVNTFLAFIGIAEQYTYGKVPWGPYDASSLQEYPKKGRMKRLLRAGIIPLQISMGGIRTYKKGDVWVQSKGRAHFDFVVPWPAGYSANPIPEYDRARSSFVERLQDQTKYPTTVTWFENADATPVQSDAVEQPEIPKYLEVGATSWTAWLLPLKRDKVLKGSYSRSTTLKSYMANPGLDLPVLANVPHAMVHIEASDHEPHRLDKFVHELATQAQLMDLWPEDELSKTLAVVYRDMGVRWEQESL